MRKKKKISCETCAYWDPLVTRIPGFGGCKNKDFAKDLQPTPVTYKDFACRYYRKKRERKGFKSKKYWKEKADKIWAKVIAKRAGYKCEWCGKADGKLEAHHIISRRFVATRHDIENGIYLCFACHMKAHQNPEEFREFLINRFGKERLERLKNKAQQKIPQDYEAIYKELKQIYGGV